MMTVQRLLFLFGVCLPFIALASSESYKSVELPGVEIPVYEQQCSSFEIYQENFALGMCRFPDRDTDKNYGWRFVIFEQQDSVWKEKFMSSGFMDAYSVDPYFFSPQNVEPEKHTDWLLILESAAEYPWGIDVYTLPSDDAKPVKLGEIPIITASEDDGDSLIPYLDVSHNSGHLEISVGIDTVFLSEKITETYPAGSVKYVEKQGKLVMERIKP